MEVFHRMFVHDSLINHVFIIKIFCFRINYFKKNWYILLFPLKLTDLLFHSFGHVTSINLQQKLRVRVMVFNATFCNISVISGQSVLLVEKTTILLQVTDKLYHIMLTVVSKSWRSWSNVNQKELSKKQFQQHLSSLIVTPFI
jgi:hypothetical protein